MSYDEITELLEQLRHLSASKSRGVLVSTGDLITLLNYISQLEDDLECAGDQLMGEDL